MCEGEEASLEGRGREEDTPPQCGLVEAAEEGGIGLLCILEATDRPLGEVYAPPRAARATPGGEADPGSSGYECSDDPLTSSLWDIVGLGIAEVVQLSDFSCHRV